MTDYQLEIIDDGTNNSNNKHAARHNHHHHNRRHLPYRYPPFFIIFISIFELFTFVYYALRSEELITLTGPVPFKSKLIFNPYRRYEFWRYLTYMLIHAGYWHLSFNLLIQMFVGIPLEVVHKFNPIFIIYIGGVIGGALGNSIADPHSYLAGASGGCYALIAAHLSNLIINWDETNGACLKLLSVLTFSLADLGTAIYERHFKLGSLAYRTSYGGHLAGAVSGLLLGLVFLRNARIHHWEQVAAGCAAAIYLTLMTIAIGYSVFNPTHFPLPDYSDLIWTQSPFRLDRE